MGEVPQEVGGREPSPAGTGAPDQGETRCLTSCPVPYESGVCTFQKMGNAQNEKRRQGRAGAPIVLPATGDGKRPENRAFREPGAGSVAGTPDKGPLPERAH